MIKTLELLCTEYFNKLNLFFEENYLKNLIVQLKNKIDIYYNERIKIHDEYEDQINELKLMQEVNYSNNENNFTINLMLDNLILDKQKEEINLEACFNKQINNFINEFKDKYIFEYYSFIFDNEISMKFFAKNNIHSIMDTETCKKLYMFKDNYIGEIYKLNYRFIDNIFKLINTYK